MLQVYIILENDGCMTKVISYEPIFSLYFKWVISNIYIYRIGDIKFVYYIGNNLPTL